MCCQPIPRRQGILSLVDTGAAVSMIHREMLAREFPNLPVRGLEEVLDTPLELTSASSHKIPFHGVVNIEVEASFDDHHHCVVEVPFLVTSIPLPEPIVGFNVMEALIENES